MENFQCQDANPWGTACLALSHRPDDDDALKAPVKDGVVLSPYPPLELIPDESFYQHLQRRFLPRADELALERNGQWLTFGDVLNLLERYAGGFQRCGVSTGSRVCVNVSNSAEALLATYAICCAGAAAVLAKPSLTEREVLYQAQDSESSFILTEKKNVEKVLNVHNVCKFKGLFSIDRVEGFQCVRDFEDENSGSFDEPFIDDAKKHIMLYTYTSGTTGLPKGVEIPMNAFNASIELMRMAEVYYEDDVFLGWNPVTHASGFVLPAAAWCSGARVVPSAGGLSASEFVDVVNKHQVTSLCAFPTAFRKLVFDLQEGLVPSLKRILTCGTVSTEDLYRRILQVFQLKSLRNGYGLSETIGFVCITAPNTIGLQSIGYPLSEAEVKVVDADTGVALGAGELGEIMFRSANLMRGYHNRPEATAEVLDDQRWFRSGDAGYHDGSGRFYVVERLKDMIKCLDQQVAPAEVETLLTEHPLVLEAAVVGIKHPDFGEAPTAFVVLQPGAQDRVGEQDLLRLVADQAASHKHLHGGVVFVDSIPKTDTGKYMRRKLRAQHMATLGK
ncbi:luciferin 4-monooxygenase-like isoform X2 [Haemaphysalis longicornis]